MGEVSYSEKLLDPRWQRKRLEIFSRDNWTCQKCGEMEESLHIHHKYYSPGCDPWEYLDDALVTWCGTCHSKHHGEYAEPVSVPEHEPLSINQICLQRAIAIGDEATVKKWRRLIEISDLLRNETESYSDEILEEFCDLNRELKGGKPAEDVAK